MTKAYLQLSDGTIYEGISIGSGNQTAGEVVFTTGMVGYEQSLTDPSYNGQILVFTYPLIGNYGIPIPTSFVKGVLRNFESERIWAKGVIVAEASLYPSHRSSVQSFSQWLIAQGICGIAGIDTRSLTKKLRDHGTMHGKISSRLRKLNKETTPNVHLVAEASCKKPRTYTPLKPNGKRVLVIDCGVKHGILRSLLARGLTVIRIPWNSDPTSYLGHIHGVLISNGPGDPRACQETITHVARLLETDVAILGICLGHQILALAAGADTFKLPFGHRGVNQPCLALDLRKSYITSQNHGYAVRTDSVPTGFVPWFTNLNDGTNEGIRHQTKKIWAVQFHPEGSPGPTDTEWIFDLLLT